MSSKLLERMTIENVLPPTDALPSNSNWFSLEGCRQAVLYCFSGALGDQQTLTAAVLQAKDDQGTDNKDLKQSVFTQTQDGNPGSFSVNIDLSELDEGYTHIAVELDSSGVALAGVILIKGDLRYSPTATA